MECWCTWGASDGESVAGGGPGCAAEPKERTAPKRDGTRAYAGSFAVLHRTHTVLPQKKARTMVHATSHRVRVNDYCTLHCTHARGRRSISVPRGHCTLPPACSSASPRPQTLRGTCARLTSLHAMGAETLGGCNHAVHTCSAALVLRGMRVSQHDLSALHTGEYCGLHHAHVHTMHECIQR